MSRYDDVSHLLADLDMERRYKEKIEMENTELEKTIGDLESYCRHLDDVAVTGSAEDNEWKVRYEAEKALDRHLTDYKAWLEAELGEQEWRFHSGSYPEAMNFNLDLLTELELVRLVKHMERVKADYYNQVRDTEYKADRETKEFHHFDDVRRCYKADLRHATQSVERMKMEEILDRQAGAGTPPMFSPAYVRWLDNQALEDRQYVQHLKSSKSKSRSKSLPKESKRSKSKSPGRSKSRIDKSRSKNKDDTEENEPSTEEGSGGSGGTEGSEKSGEEKAEGEK